MILIVLVTCPRVLGTFSGTLFAVARELETALLAGKPNARRNAKCLGRARVGTESHCYNSVPHNQLIESGPVRGKIEKTKFGISSS